MSPLTLRWIKPAAVMLSIFLVAGTAALASTRILSIVTEICATPAPMDASFSEENEAAMSRMMHDMAITPSADVDRDFVAMMVPHHQGAIDMARAVLRHGRNPQIRRLAQEIIVTQQQEIAVMRLAVGRPQEP